MELAALGVFLVGAGVLISLVLSQADNQGIEVVKSTANGIPDDDRLTTDLLVDVAGAVINPGVYRLAAGSRLADALAAAGGLSATADRQWVSKSLNLAQNITDGIKIYIPQLGGETAGRSEVFSSGEPVSDLSGSISINTASLTDLDRLWGVGEIRAKAIIAGRPYGSIEELVSRKILPSHVVDRNRNKLVL